MLQKISLYSIFVRYNLCRYTKLFDAINNYKYLLIIIEVDVSETATGHSRRYVNSGRGQILVIISATWQIIITATGVSSLGERERWCSAMGRVLHSLERQHLHDVLVSASVFFDKA